MKTAGIIGGLGPVTTAQFYLELIQSCGKIDCKIRPPILIWNVPVDNKEENKLLLKSKKGESFLPLLIEGARILERAGADFLVMPCNSMHIFIDQIKEAVNIPVINIIEITVLEINKRKIRRVGVLSTGFTKKNKLFLKELAEQNIEVNNLGVKEQQLLNSLINKLVMGKIEKRDGAIFSSIVKWFVNKGVTNLVLGCTDLQLICGKKGGVRFFDTFKILIQETTILG